MEIGEKIRLFRTGRKMTQLDLELELDASPGTISRIESGKVNPTKETIDKLTKCLNLTYSEKIFLFDLDSPDKFTSNDIDKAIEEVKDILNSNTIAYLLDDYFRFYSMSNILAKIMGLKPEDILKYRGRSVLELIAEEDSPGHKVLDKNYIVELLTNQLALIMQEKPFFIHTQYFKNIYNNLSKNKFFIEAWRNINDNTKKIYSFTPDFRYVYFNFKGLKVKLKFVREKLSIDSRFILTYYEIDNPILNKLYNILTATS